MAARGPVTGWFYVGYGNSIVRPNGNWPMSLVYACNDDDLSDNHGWLHVHERWVW